MLMLTFIPLVGYFMITILAVVSLWPLMFLLVAIVFYFPFRLLPRDTSIADCSCPNHLYDFALYFVDCIDDLGKRIWSGIMTVMMFLICILFIVSE
jgi:hypothetical protein